MLSDTVEGVEVLAVLVEIVEGVQKRSLSLARQWGRFRDGNGRRSGGYGLGLGAVADELPRLAGDCSGALKHVRLEPIVLEDAADELVLELGLSSGSLCCLLSNASLVEDSGGVGRVPSLLEFPELSG